MGFQRPPMDIAVAVSWDNILPTIPMRPYNRTGSPVILGQAVMFDMEATNANSTNSNFGDDANSVFSNVILLNTTTAGENQNAYGFMGICMEAAAANAKVKVAIQGRVQANCTTEGGAAAIRGTKIISVPGTSTSVLIAQLTSAQTAATKVWGMLLEAHDGTGGAGGLLKYIAFDGIYGF